MANWQLFLAFPNIVPPNPTPFAESGVCLCSAADSRLKELGPGRSRKTSRLLLRRFSTSLGRRYKPGCLIVSEDAPAEAQTADALRSFRNVCCLATTTRAWADSITNENSQWIPLWSDFFAFGYHAPGRSGALITLGGPAEGITPAAMLQDYRAKAAPHIGLPTNFRLLIDEALLRRLLIAWRRFFIQRRERTVFRRLFRSLEVAFHANLYPSDGLQGVTDAGMRLALWVSAFEVLFHPGGGASVNKKVVQTALRNGPWTESALHSRRYTITQGVRVKVTLPEAIYDDLYAARNQFLHGNPVNANDLHYRRSNSYVLLLDMAPVLYNAALLSFLRAKIPGEPDVIVDTAQYWMDRSHGLDAVQNALLATRYKLGEFGVPDVT